MRKTVSGLPDSPACRRKLPPAGIPESLNVLLHELRGLALSVKLE